MLNVFNPETRWLRRKKQIETKKQQQRVSGRWFAPNQSSHLAKTPGDISGPFKIWSSKIRFEHHVHSLSFIFPHICCHKLARLGVSSIFSMLMDLMDFHGDSGSQKPRFPRHPRHSMRAMKGLAGSWDCCPIKGQEAMGHAAPVAGLGWRQR